jgi:3D (Asp-Asp-Asp) domain-containing protein
MAVRLNPSLADEPARVNVGVMRESNTTTSSFRLRWLLTASVIAVLLVSATAATFAASRQPLVRASMPAAAHLTAYVPESGSDVQVQPRTIKMEVTAYCPCSKCCGPKAVGLTASGKDVSYNDGRFVAADTRNLPFGTKLLVPGYDESPVEVIDRGGAIKGNKLDVFFPTHEQALEWGRRHLTVTVLE